MRLTRTCLIAALGLSVAAAASAAATVVVTQANRAFSLREVRLRRGDVLRFTNADEFLHHLYVNSPSFTFTSEEQAPGRTVDIRFTAAGNFEVRCEIHPKMLLQVSVE